MAGRVAMFSASVDPYAASKTANYVNMARGEDGVWRVPGIVEEEVTRKPGLLRKIWNATQSPWAMPALMGASMVAPMMSGGMGGGQMPEYGGITPEQQYRLYMAEIESRRPTVAQTIAAYQQAMR